MGEDPADAPSAFTLERAQAIVRQHQREQTRKWLQRARRPAAWILLALSILWAIRGWVNGPYPPWRAGLSGAAVVFSAALLIASYAPPSEGRRKLAAAGAAALLAAGVFVGAGGLRYTYGSEGKLEFAYTLQVTQVTVGVNSTIRAVETLTNVGSSTVRLAPAFTVKAFGSENVLNGIHNEGCGVDSRTPYDDRIFVEVSPGAKLSYTAGFAVLWVANASTPFPLSDRPCGAVVLDHAGTYQVLAEMSSGPVFEATTLPVWAGSVEAPPAAFTAS